MPRNKLSLLSLTKLLQRKETIVNKSSQTIAFVKIVGYGSLFLAGVVQALGYTDVGAYLMALGAVAAGGVKE